MWVSSQERDQVEDEDEDIDADDESCTASLRAVLEMQMWMRALIIYHSCEVIGNVFTVYDNAVCNGCDNQKIHK